MLLIRKNVIINSSIKYIFAYYYGLLFCMFHVPSVCKLHLSLLFLYLSKAFII